MMGESSRGKSLFGSFSSEKEQKNLLFLKKKKQKDFCFFAAARAAVFIVGVFAPQMVMAREQQVDPARLKAAMDTARAISNPDGVKQMLDLMRPGMIRLYVNQDHLTTDTANHLFQTIVEPSLQAHYGDLVTAQAKALAEIFTVPELTQIRDFYASPVGQKYVTNSGIIGAAMANTMQSFLQDVMVQAKGFAKSHVLPKVQGP